MAAEPIVEGARAVQEHPGDRSGTQTATRGAPRSAPTTTDGPDANPRPGKRVKIETYRHTPCDARSVPVCFDPNSSKRFKRYPARKSRAQWVSQSERFVTGGDPPMRATSQQAIESTHRAQPGRRCASGAPQRAQTTAQTNTVCVTVSSLSAHNTHCMTHWPRRSARVRALNTVTISMRDASPHYAAHQRSAAVSVAFLDVRHTPLE